MKVIDRKTKEPLNSKYDDKMFVKLIVYQQFLCEIVSL